MTTPDDSRTDIERERDLHEVLVSAPIDSAHMRTAIRAHAAFLRERGMLPEQMLVRVKNLVAPVMASRRLPGQPATDHGRDLLRLTRWAVESYYGLPGRELGRPIVGAREGVVHQDGVVENAVEPRRFD